eukprot:CAMPEP_0206187258 /NCGR_PEP_ID=MMETSP0166-20121206/2891_1 /ASSEMBLY_ACC=CAM_ASM_000260 /TAXON_ID=95228 /ORGANISM="Vannella robusta, Strain DIVA3 518/3/11/1/6" /LENGTH=235 /DNA_ID=CAMNT_0053602799 /DNA_START=85 /DNA_END=792 /DNA_ORIENTATION=-
MIEEATNEENSVDNELLQAERSLELQLIQEEQRLSALNLVRNKTSGAIKNQEAKLAGPRKASSDNAKILADKKKELETLRTKESRLTRKLGSVQKYNSSLSAQVAALNNKSDTNDAEAPKLRSEITRITAEIETSKAETNQTISQFQQVENKCNANKDTIDKLNARVSELQKELDFAQAMKEKLGNVPAVPSRRGRSLHKSSPPEQEAPQPPEEEAPKVPPRRPSALADRMKMFQ